MACVIGDNDRSVIKEVLKDAQGDEPEPLIKPRTFESGFKELKKSFCISCLQYECAHHFPNE